VTDALELARRILRLRLPLLPLLLRLLLLPLLPLLMVDACR
jgi:hypothetical protein